MAATHTVTVSVGKPFGTGEECPECRFDSVMAALVFVESVPSFMWFCGRCKKRVSDG